MGSELDSLLFGSFDAVHVKLSQRAFPVSTVQVDVEPSATSALSVSGWFEPPAFPVRHWFGQSFYGSRALRRCVYCFHRATPSTGVELLVHPADAARAATSVEEVAGLLDG